MNANDLVTKLINTIGAHPDVRVTSYVTEPIDLDSPVEHKGTVNLSADGWDFNVTVYVTRIGSTEREGE